MTRRRAHDRVAHAYNKDFFMAFWIDTHAHLISYKYTAEQLPLLLERARQKGVEKVVTLGTSPNNWAQHLALSERFSPWVSVALGVHPCDVTELSEGQKEEVFGFLEQEACSGRLVALGETGLDYFHPAPEGWEEEAYRARQAEFLERHYEIAQKAGLNVVVHTRDKKGSASFDKALEIAARYAPQVKTVFHCFIGNEEQAARVWEIGGFLSFTGILTFKNARSVLEVAKTAPLGRFFLETDSPYLAPEPYRGECNEPSYVKEIGEFLAEARGMSAEALAEATRGAAEGFFRFSSEA